MKLKTVDITNFRAIEKLHLELHPQLTVFHGMNGHGKTSVLAAIAVGLGAVAKFLPDVAGVNFRRADRRLDGQYTEVELTTTDGLVWSRQTLGGPKRSPLAALKRRMEEIVRADQAGAVQDLPIVAYYDTDRVAFDEPKHVRGFPSGTTRYRALKDALSARTDFRAFFKWFAMAEYSEFRKGRDRSDSGYELAELQTVRSAIQGMLGAAANPRVAQEPPRFVVTLEDGCGSEDDCSVDQLSGGQRAVLVLAADLASRMALGNPHLEDPLRSEAIVLVDEVDLHLHPAWQQRVLPDLMATFPKAQFVVSTHSPYVLSSVKPEHVLNLSRHGDGIRALPPAGATFGAEASHISTVSMGVRQRPPKNGFAKAFAEYLEAIEEDDWETGDEPDAELRRRLEDLSPDDPGLDEADLAIVRRQVEREMEE